MKIYEAWDELREWLDSRVDYWHGRGAPEIARTYLAVLRMMDELEMKHE